MAEFLANALQEVPAGQNILFTEDLIPCNKGYVIHRAGSGIFTLRGVTNNCFARYLVEYSGNIQITDGGTPGPIAVALALDGEILPTSEAIVTPAATEELWNVSVFAYVTVPRGCCQTLAVENASDQAIEVQNSNLIINRVA